MITIKDIAREAGYSVSTVSRAIANHPDISETAKARINEIVAKHRFVPNSNARHLKQQESNTISILVKGNSNMLFASIVEAMQPIIEVNGYTAAATYLDEDANEVIDAIQLCRENKPAGLIFLGGNIEYFRESFKNISTPSVLVTTSAAELSFDNLSSVSTDDHAAAACAIDYLLANGHRCIGIIGGSLKSSFASIRRFSGCLESFERAGVSFLPDVQYQKSRFSYAGAYKALGLLYDRMPDISALFCMSDVMAIGAVRALRDRALSVPDDVSVIGFDGIELAEYYNPKIATIKQNHEQIARRGVEILLDCIRQNARATHEVAAHTLQTGESVRSCFSDAF